MKKSLRRLTENYNVLQERAAKFGINKPLSLVNRIEDHKTAIYFAEKAVAGEISIKELRKSVAGLNLDLPSQSILKRHLNTREDFQKTLLQFHANRDILREREARYGGRPPLELFNQLQDYDEAIGLAEAAVEGKISRKEFIEEIKPLILDY